VPPSIAASGINIDRQFGELKRQTGLAGVSWRARDKFSVNFDFEGAASDLSYYRTSLHDYRKARLQARYQILEPLSLTGRFSVLDNERPRPNYTAAGPRFDYDFTSRDNSLTLAWTSRMVNVVADYTRSTIASNTDFLNPGGITELWVSDYRENAHVGTLLAEVKYFSFGGSFYRSSGSRPVRYYQPTARAAIPVYKNVEFNFDWRWYGFTQPFYLYEGFRAHTFVTGFRFKI
jgi:hypothetical protein